MGGLSPFPSHLRRRWLSRTLRLGEEMGGLRTDVWRAQFKHTIKRHLEKELQVQGRGAKVLSLFFIDRVANYRDYDGPGRPAPGKFAQAFAEELAALAKDERYRELAWLREPVEKLVESISLMRHVYLQSRSPNNSLHQTELIAAPRTC